jgi:phosphoglycerate dehydrogenase-like enzyme
MKRGAYLINTCRGPIVDEDALLTALQEGWIAGAGLDVYCEEPLPLDHPLMQLKNVILTPHIGGFSEETLESASMSVAKRVLQVLQGDVPDNLVNRGALQNR